VTGASTADLSVILIDARKGVLSQSKRHAAVSALLGIKHLVVAINKMDLVGFKETAYCEIVREFGGFARKLGVPNVTFIPISALLGDNVVEQSENMPWHDGPTLLGHLEQVDVSAKLEHGLRLPIQFVIRPHQDYRGFAGRIESGSVRIGDLVEIASTGLQANIQSILVSGVEADHAIAGQSVAVSFDREIDVSRGDLLHSPTDRPVQANRVDAVVCWMHEQPLEVGKRYLIMHASRRISAVIERVVHRVDVDTLEHGTSANLGLNDLGRVTLRTANPLFFDRYSDIQGTGSFVLVDPSTHATVAGGMLQGPTKESEVADATAGQAVWLEGFDAEIDRLTADLRAFGKQVILIRDSDGLSQEDLHEWITRLTGQGFNVLISAPNAAVADIRHIKLQDFSRGKSPLEAILALL